jgi:hypothetical protein
MALDVNLKDSSSGTPAEVDASGNLLVTFPGYTAAGVSAGGGPEQGPAAFFENDPGTITGARYVKSPEVTEDFQLRVSHDHILDRETFNYTAQNTGKHSHTFTTMTATVSANGLLCNSGNITTTSTGFTFGTFAEYPCAHAGATTYYETSMSLNTNINSIPANFFMDVGAIRRGVTTAFVPLDGAYFRFSSAGITAVINRNATETVEVLTGVSGILANESHKYTISVTEREVEFWIDDIRYASISTPSTNGQVVLGATLPWGLRCANVGAPSAAVQALVSDYTVSYGGAMYSSAWSAVGNRSLGSYQGLSGGTMGSLATYANSTTPASAAGSNTAANATGLGGQGHINAAVTAATDFIMTSYQVPAGTVAVQGRRLVVTGVKISAANLGAAVATTATTIACSLAFGHTAVSMATTDTASFATATTKAPRRIALGMMYWPVGAVIGQVASPGDLYMQFVNPIYVNPGEFIATTLKFITGTATASQTIYYHVTFDYGWE